MYTNRRNFRVFDEIWVEKHDDDVRYFRPKVEIWPFRACAMNNMQQNPYYRNSSVIVNLSMGQMDTMFRRTYFSYFEYISL